MSFPARETPTHASQVDTADVAARTIARAPDTGPALEWAQARMGDGGEHPDVLPHVEAHLDVERTFCFADLSGFTAYTRANGPHVAVERLAEFRRVTRSIAAVRGVRVAKWLGDGVMLVGVDPTPVVAWGAHMIGHFAGRGIDVRVGLATGTALLFEGDDYIGEPVNLAAKLCSAARSGEVLAHCDLDALPTWVRVIGDVDVDIRGVGRISGIQRLTPEWRASATEGAA